MPNENTECCPKFDPTPWEGKEWNWEGKRFVKDRVFTLFYMPINFGSVITRMIKKIEGAGTVAQDWMALSDHTSLWNMDLYVAVDKEIPDMKNVTLSGKFFSKVYEGAFKDTGVWCKDFADSVRAKGLALKKMYMWYTTCPKCAKKYGKNYTVIVGEIE